MYFHENYRTIYYSEDTIQLEWITDTEFPWKEDTYLDNTLGIMNTTVAKVPHQRYELAFYQWLYLPASMLDSFSKWIPLYFLVKIVYIDLTGCCMPWRSFAEIKVA